MNKCIIVCDICKRESEIYTKIILFTNVSINYSLQEMHICKNCVGDEIITFLNAILPNYKIEMNGV